MSIIYILKIISLYCSILLTLTGCTPVVEIPIEEPKPQIKLLYEWNFSEADPLHDLGELTQNVTVVADPLDQTNKVLQFVLPVGEYRAEASVGKNKPHYFYADTNDPIKGDEIWMGFRILKFKESFASTNTSPSIFQIGPIQNTVSNPGISSSGHYQLMLNTRTNKWRWREFSSVFNPNSYGSDITAVNYGKWEKFVIHCIFRSDDTALLEIWQNDIKIYSEKRQNGTKHSRTRIKWGIYIGSGSKANDALKCYFDDVKIGGSEANYELVAPK